MMFFTLFLPVLLRITSAQSIGTFTTETHPRLFIQSCPPGAPCTTVNTSLVLDENWRWAHRVDDLQNCYSWGQWEPKFCSNNKDCAKACAVDGAEYKVVYGVTTSGANLNLTWITKYDYSQSVSSRVFMLDEGSDDKYKMWKLLNREIAFDVDTSQVTCGLSASMYLVGMDEDGGMARFNTNKAGARYGTGYCDAKCPRNLRFISGEANAEGWIENELNDYFLGTGNYGSCCPEVDIWQANSVSNALTAHPCTINQQTRCSGLECESMCDGEGCEFNSYRLGDKPFYGSKMVVDTTKKFTVITQFVTKDNTDTGDLVEIRRKYVQNGVVISNSISAVPSVSPSSSITDAFCRQQKAAFSEKNTFFEQGGMTGVGKAMKRGMVLVFAISEDQERHLLWLDSLFPLDADPTKPGVARGDCETSSGKPADLLYEQQRAKVTFGNIRIGEIGGAERALENRK